MIMRMNQKGMTQVWMVGLAMAGLMSQSSWAYLPKLGEEFSVLPPMVGDQVNAQLAMGQEGGYLVWEDNSIDGKGKGIAAARLNAEYHLEFSPFAVNQEAEGDQVNPQIATNETGHSLITWEQDGNLFGRILNPDGSFDADAFSLGSHQHEEGNLKIEGFGWNAIETADGKITAEKENAVREIVWMKNKYPYAWEDGVEHFLCWSTGGPTLSVHECINAIQENVGPDKEVAWFTNSMENRSVPEIDHIQVIVRSKPSHSQVNDHLQ